MRKLGSCRWRSRPGRLLLHAVCLTIFILIFACLHILRGSGTEATAPTVRVETYTARKEKLESSCARTYWSRMPRVFYSQKYQLCYCGVAKVGCTFWKQVIRYLNKDTRGKIYAHPQDFPRTLVHWNMKNTTQTYFQNKVNFFSNYDRFMFVRNPYSRLWSAYIDKIYLPDKWYSYPQPEERFKPNESCPSKVTFEEFLKWVVHTPLRRMDTHWIPMSASCHPCLFKPDFIGKMETFAEDARYILSRHNLSWIVDRSDGHHREDEVKMLIRYNYELLRDKATRKCIDANQLALRLWKSFQINGHLSSDEAFTLFHGDTVSEEDFTNLVLATLRRQTKSSTQLKKQKLLYMTKAYKSVSSPTLKAIRKKYALDFEMFGYDPMNPYNPNAGH